MRRVLPVLALALLACDRGPLTVVTYNAGLAVGFVDGAEERAEGVAAEVAALEADVVCVQEVWRSDHVDAFVDAAAETFPHTWFPPPRPQVLALPACAAGDLDDFAACARTNCGEACVDEVAECVLSSCVGPFGSLPDGCGRCVAAHVGGTIDEIETECTTHDPRYGYDGSFGIGLLSKRPLSDQEICVFESQLLRRGAIHVKTGGPRGTMDVYCTHLAADLSPLPYPGEGSWEDENEAHVAELLDWIGATGTTGRVVALGDLNTGPAGEGIVAELPGSWADIERAAYDVPFVEQDGRCTLCPENPLRGDGDPKLIDHVLLDGFDGATSAERLFEETLALQTCEGTIDAAWSDHYGVAVTVQP